MIGVATGRDAIVWDGVVADVSWLCLATRRAAVEIVEVAVVAALSRINDSIAAARQADARLAAAGITCFKLAGRRAAVAIAVVLVVTVLVAVEVAVSADAGDKREAVDGRRCGFSQKIGANVERSADGVSA